MVGELEQGNVPPASYERILCAVRRPKGAGHGREPKTPVS